LRTNHFDGGRSAGNRGLAESAL
ncbi:uncharacterized protein METZ01_LOCUS393696, partial [marine metagenome]